MNKKKKGMNLTSKVSESVFFFWKVDFAMPLQKKGKNVLLWQVKVQCLLIAHGREYDTMSGGVFGDGLHIVNQ